MQVYSREDVKRAMASLQAMAQEHVHDVRPDLTSNPTKFKYVANLGRVRPPSKLDQWKSMSLGGMMGPCPGYTPKPRNKRAGAINLARLPKVGS